MKHDDHCERSSGRNTCHCAERAYQADPFVDEYGRPIRAPIDMDLDLVRACGYGLRPAD